MKDKQEIYEHYLSVALRFVEEGNLKPAKRCLKIMKRTLKRLKKDKKMNDKKGV